MQTRLAALFLLLGTLAILLTLELTKDRSLPLQASSTDATSERVAEADVPVAPPSVATPPAVAPPPPLERAEPAATVARVNGVPIDANAVRTEMVRHGADFLSRFGKLEEKEAVVEDLVRIQVLAQTAREVGFAEDPQVRDAVNRLLAERYWRDQMSRFDLPPVTEDEARAFYDEHPERYTESLRARGAVIQLRVQRDASRSERAELRAEAEQLRTEAMGASDSRFAALVREHSDDRSTRDRAGDMGFIADGARVFRYEPAVVEALFSIDEPGGVAPVVETERAFVVVRLTDRQGGVLAPFPAVEPEIRRHLAEERRRAKQAELYAELRSRFEIEIERDVLETVGPQDLAANDRPPRFPVGESAP